MIRDSRSPNDVNPDTLSEERRIRLRAAEQVRLEALDKLQSRAKSRRRVIAGLVLLISGLLAVVILGPGFQNRLASMQQAAASALTLEGARSIGSSFSLSTSGITVDAHS